MMGRKMKSSISRKKGQNLNEYYLHNHGVNLVWRELELVPRERVSQTQLHGSHFFVCHSCRRELEPIDI